MDQCTPLRILCIDGGGVRGVASLRIIRSLSEVANGKHPHELFDLICGSGSGGVLAYLLGVLKLSLPECREFFQRLCQEVYSLTSDEVEEGSPRVLQCDQELKKQIQLELTNLNLANDLKMSQDPPTSTPRTRVFMVSRRLGHPYLFRNYQDGNSAEGTDDVTVWEAIHATSATPSYFSRITINGQIYDNHISLNNPTKRCLIEAKNIMEWSNRPLGVVVSLGAGKAKYGPSNNLGDLSTASEAVHHDIAFSEYSFCYERFNPGDGVGDYDLSNFKDIPVIEAATETFLSEPEIFKRIKSLGQLLSNPGLLTQTGVAPVIAAYQMKRDREAWVSKWQGQYGGWCKAMDGFLSAAGFSRKDSRVTNGLALARFFGFSMNSPSSSDHWEKLNEIRRMVRNNLLATTEISRDHGYMSEQGYSEAFNMSVLAMGLDAANANAISLGNGQDTLTLNDYGAILLVLLSKGDFVHVELLRKYKKNKKAFPETEANEVLRSAQDFVTQCEKEEINLPPHLKKFLPELQQLILESTPKE